MSLLFARELLAQEKYSEALDCLANIKSGSRFRASTPEFCAEIVRSDIYCLAGNYEQAQKHAINAWRAAPRSRQVAYLLKISNKNDAIRLARYAKVGLFICPNGPCWQAILDSTCESLSEDTSETIMERYKTVKKELEDCSKEEKSSFWLQFYPFEIEYICLNAISSCDKQMVDEILSFYRNYRYSMRGTSREQKVHARLFELQLKQMLQQSSDSSF